MTLLKCEECGREMSDKAKMCPQCGCPLSAADTEAPDQSQYAAPILLSSRPAPLQLLDSLTNPRLPRMANWICIYCLGVNPALVVLFLPWTFSGAASAGANSRAFGLALLWDAVQLLIELALAVALFIGGLKLKRLHASARRWVSLTLYGSLASIAFSLLGSMFVWAIEAAVAPSTAIQSDPAAWEAIIGLSALLLFVAIVVFQIVAVVWIARHGNELPVDEPALH